MDLNLKLSDGSAVPVASTLDGSGRVAITHVNAMLVGGVATPVSAAAPQPVVDLATEVAVTAVATNTAALGAAADAAWAGSGPASLVSLMKWLGAKLGAVLTVQWSGQSVAVSGTVAVQDTSAEAALAAVAAGMATAAGQASGLAQQTAAATVLGATTDTYAGSGASTIAGTLRGIFAKLAGTLTTTISGSVAVTGTFFQATQPVTGTVAVKGQALAYAAPAASVPVGTSSTAVVSAGAYTNLLLLQTAPGSTANVWLNLVGGAAVVGQGLFIPAGGGSVTLGNASLPMPTGAIAGISDGAAVSVSIQGA